MAREQIARQIRYQEDLSPDFGKTIAATPGGESLSQCIQCGTCSSTCPLSIYMDYTPRKIIAMTRSGFKDEVLHSNTIWLCASCYACTVECPREIKITDIMYSLKQRAIKDKVYPKRFPIPVLAREFYKSVFNTGRSNEGRTVTYMFLKTNPFKIFGQIGLGIKLLLRGRMVLREEKMKGGHQQLRDLLNSVEKHVNK